jgi:hypothetical protein
MFANFRISEPSPKFTPEIQPFTSFSGICKYPFVNIYSRINRLPVMYGGQAGILLLFAKYNFMAGNQIIVEKF